MPQEKKLKEKEEEPKKYKVFEKKEAAHVTEYRFKKKMTEQLQVSTATSTSETTPTMSSAYQQSKYGAEVVTRLKDHSHSIHERRSLCLKLFPKNSFYV